MQIYLFKDNQQSGPHSFEQLREAAGNGGIVPGDMIWYEGCASWMEASVLPGLFPRPVPQAPLLLPQSVARIADPDGPLIRRISDYEKVSGIIWICLGAFQLLTVVGIIAGVWNIYAGITRIRASKNILARLPGIPAAFESMAGLIIIGVINLLIGGVIGIAFVAFDFYIRDLILTNAALFNGGRRVSSTPPNVRRSPPLARSASMGPPGQKR